MKYFVEELDISHNGKSWWPAANEENFDQFNDCHVNEFPDKYVAVKVAIAQRGGKVKKVTDQPLIENLRKLGSGTIRISKQTSTYNNVYTFGPYEPIDINKIK